MGKVQIAEFNPATNKVQLTDSSFQYAEGLAGHRLDRRLVYRIVNNIVHVQQSFTMDCVNCQYENGSSVGCKECGYTRKKRCTHFHPIKSMEELVPSPF